MAFRLMWVKPLMGGIIAILLEISRICRMIYRKKPVIQRRQGCLPAANIASKWTAVLALLRE